MIGGILLIFLLYGLSQPLLDIIKRKHRVVNRSLLNSVYWYHALFTVIYYAYATFNSSDSLAYFARAERASTGFLETYSTGTGFIDFVAYPFVAGMGFSYEMMMVLFSWAGYWGFVFFYICFRENTRYNHKVLGFDMLKLLMFLPNMHFWTVSLGKGSLIFMGLGIATYGLSKIRSRIPALVWGLVIVYHVRPHVFLFMCMGIILGLFTGREKIPLYQKILVLGGGIIAMFILYDKVLGFVGLDSENVVESFESFSGKRAAELAKAGSGVDTSNYPLLLKLFTFWFRPLFVDAPGALGLFVSCENLIYVILTAKLFDRQFIKYLRKSPALVKSSIIIFIASSIALSTTMANLGIIIRQKSMVMYFYFFLILSFVDYKKHLLVLKREKRKKRAAELSAMHDTSTETGLSH